ncbi:hypothetical protein QUA54_26785 [Microcoleus sp. MOSTC5]
MRYPRVRNVGTSDIITGRSTIALLPLRLKILARANLESRLEV